MESVIIGCKVSGIEDSHRCFAFSPTFLFFFVYQEMNDPEPTESIPLLEARRRALLSLSTLSEKLFTLRERYVLPGTDVPESKRRKLGAKNGKVTEDEEEKDEEEEDQEEEEQEVEDLVEGQSWWLGNVKDSLELGDA